MWAMFEYHRKGSIMSQPIDLRIVPANHASVRYRSSFLVGKDGLFCRIGIQMLGLEHADWLKTRVDVSGLVN
jgi:hypothetical protein